MEGPKCLPCTVRQNSLLMKLDIKDAYLTGSMNPRSYQFIQFQWNTKPHQYLVMPFGLSIALDLYQNLKHPIKLLESTRIVHDNILRRYTTCNTRLRYESSLVHIQCYYINLNSLKVRHKFLGQIYLNNLSQMVLFGYPFEFNHHVNNRANATSILTMPHDNKENYS